MMLGDFDIEDFTDTSHFSISICLFVVFMYLVNIIMLNLLIAIMGDVFDRMQENSRAMFLYHKT